NPFYVLGLPPDASRTEIERQGAKLLGMLELRLKSALRYPTPFGPAERDADKVRQAMAELRDPERRLGHELWARLDPLEAAAADPAPGEDCPASTPRNKAEAPWPHALAALGWLRSASSRDTSKPSRGAR